MKKNIFYIVGAFGTGKTTLTKALHEGKVEIILEDDPVLTFLSAQNSLINAYYYPSVLFYKLTRFLYSDKSLCFCDSHPVISTLYLKAFKRADMFEVDDEIIEASTNYYKTMKKWFDTVSEHLLGYEQIIWLNPPIKKNLEFIKKRYSERKNKFPQETNEKYLKAIRKEISLWLRSKNYIELKAY